MCAIGKGGTHAATAAAVAQVLPRLSTHHSPRAGACDPAAAARGSPAATTTVADVDGPQQRSMRQTRPLGLWHTWPQSHGHGTRQNLSLAERNTTSAAPFGAPKPLALFAFLTEEPCLQPSSPPPKDMRQTYEMFLELRFLSLQRREDAAPSCMEYRGMQAHGSLSQCAPDSSQSSPQAFFQEAFPHVQDARALGAARPAPRSTADHHASNGTMRLALGNHGLQERQDRRACGPSPLMWSGRPQGRPLRCLNGRTRPACSL